MNNGANVSIALQGLSANVNIFTVKIFSLDECNFTNICTKTQFP